MAASQLLLEAAEPSNPPPELGVKQEDELPETQQSKAAPMKANKRKRRVSSVPGEANNVAGDENRVHSNSRMRKRRKVSRSTGAPVRRSENEDETYAQPRDDARRETIQRVSHASPHPPQDSAPELGERVDELEVPETQEELAEEVSEQSEKKSKKVGKRKQTHASSAIISDAMPTNETIYEDGNKEEEAAEMLLVNPVGKPGPRRSSTRRTVGGKDHAKSFAVSESMVQHAAMDGEEETAEMLLVNPVGKPGPRKPNKRRRATGVPSSDHENSAPAADPESQLQTELLQQTSALEAEVVMPTEDFVVPETQEEAAEAVVQPVKKAKKARRKAIIEEPTLDARVNEAEAPATHERVSQVHSQSLKSSKQVQRNHLEKESATLLRFEQTEVPETQDSDLPEQPAKNASRANDLPCYQQAVATRQPLHVFTLLNDRGDGRLIPSADDETGESLKQPLHTAEKGISDADSLPSSPKSFQEIANQNGKQDPQRTMERYFSSQEDSTGEDIVLASPEIVRAYRKERARPVVEDLDNTQDVAVSQSWTAVNSPEQAAKAAKKPSDTWNISPGEPANSRQDGAAEEEWQPQIGEDPESELDDQAEPELHEIPATARQEGNLPKKQATAADTSKAPITNANNRNNGKFTSAEREAADETFDLWCQAESIEPSQMKERIRAWRKVPDFARAMSEVLPGRDMKAITRFCQRRYSLYESGPWTTEQDEKLKKLYAQFPKTWSQIGPRLGRAPADARDRWRNFLQYGKTLATGPWHVDEEQQLKLILAEHIKAAMLNNPACQMKAGETGPKFLDRIVAEAIDWREVAERLEIRRSRKQCIDKYRKIMHRIEPDRHSDPSKPRPPGEESKGDRRARKRMALMKNGDLYAVLEEIFNAMGDVDAVYAHTTTFWANVAMKAKDSIWTSNDRRVVYYDLMEKLKMPDLGTFGRNVNSLGQYLEIKFGQEGLDSDRAFPLADARAKRISRKKSVVAVDSDECSSGKEDIPRPSKAKTKRSSTRATKAAQKTLSADLVIESDSDSAAENAPNDAATPQEPTRAPTGPPSAPASSSESDQGPPDSDRNSPASGDNAGQTADSGQHGDAGRPEAEPSDAGITISSLNSKLVSSSNPSLSPGAFVQRCRDVGRRQYAGMRAGEGML